MFAEIRLMLFISSFAVLITRSKFLNDYLLNREPPSLATPPCTMFALVGWSRVIAEFSWATLPSIISKPLLGRELGIASEGKDSFATAFIINYDWITCCWRSTLGLAISLAYAIVESIELRLINLSGLSELSGFSQFLFYFIKLTGILKFLAASFCLRYTIAGLESLEAEFARPPRFES